MPPEPREVLPNTALQAAREARIEKQAHIETRRIARSLIIPTEDHHVRQMLRTYSQPTCYFGEDSHDRRERLRSLIARNNLSVPSDKPSHRSIPPVVPPSVNTPSASAAPAHDFYTPGSPALSALRIALARPSLRAASARLANERALAAITDPTHPARLRYRHAENSAISAVREAHMVASQVADERPLSAISISELSGQPIVATGSWGGTVKLWHGHSSCDLLQTISTHTARISVVHLPSQYPGVLLTAGADNKAELHCATHEGIFERRTVLDTHTARVSDVRMHPKRKELLVTASFDGTFVLHDQGKAVLTQVTGHNSVYGLAFHPDGGIMTTCGLDGGIRLWDLRSGRPVMTMTKAHADDVLGVEFCNDGRILASCGKDNVIRIWDLRKKRCAKTIAAHRNLISGIKFGGGLDGGDVLFSSSFDHTIKCWGAKRNWGLLAAHTSHEDKVTAIDCSVDATSIVTACYDKTWKLWGQN